MAILVKNIKQLVQAEPKSIKFRAGKEMQNLPVIDNAYLLTEGDKIKEFGKMEDFNPDILKKIKEPIEEVDATGKFVFPSFCDSHTHIVYAGSREVEYIDKIKGLSYEEIFKRGGGILNSAKRLHETSEEELYDQAWQRLEEMSSFGTGACEIKSGYGLTTEDELKMLRVIRKLKENSPLTIKANFLGAHAVPLLYKDNPDGYVDLIINEMIPMVAAEELADFVDVFCDKGFFTTENEMACSGGIQVGVKYNALSVDHLEYTGDEEIAALYKSETMPTVLPGAAFFLGMQCAPIRKMIEGGLPVALASDFNPGSCPSGNMQLVFAMGSVMYKMLPEETVNATTINTAYAMDVWRELGTITKGKIANFFITKPMDTLYYMNYAFGSNKVEQVFLNGKKM